MKSTVLIGIKIAIYVHQKIFYQFKKDYEFILAHSEMETIMSILTYAAER